MAREKSIAVLDLTTNFQKREMYKEEGKRKAGRGERNKQLHLRLKYQRTPILELDPRTLAIVEVLSLPFCCLLFSLEENLLIKCSVLLHKAYGEPN